MSMMVPATASAPPNDAVNDVGYNGQDDQACLKHKQNREIRPPYHSTVPAASVVTVARRKARRNQNCCDSNGDRRRNYDG
jgi:hypothetical protein